MFSAAFRDCDIGTNCCLRFFSLDRWMVSFSKSTSLILMFTSVFARIPVARKVLIAAQQRHSTKLSPVGRFKSLSSSASV